jgi:hypothetical protein
MINDLLKIKQDMASTHQREPHRKKGGGDDEVNDSSEWANPNDWVASIPKSGLYHREYTTEQWLQVFRLI